MVDLIDVYLAPDEIIIPWKLECAAGSIERQRGWFVWFIRVVSLKLNFLFRFDRAEKDNGMVDTQFWKANQMDDRRMILFDREQ